MSRLSERTKRLQRLTKLRENAEKIAAQNFAQVLQEQRVHANQVSELKQYRQEYANAIAQPSTESIQGFHLTQVQGFVTHMDRLIQALDERTIEIDNRKNAHQKNWANKLREAKTMAHITDECRRQAEQALQSLADAQIDDLGHRAQGVDSE